LGEVAVYLESRHRPLSVGGGQESGAVFSAGKHDFAPWCRGEIDEHRQLFGHRDVHH